MFFYNYWIINDSSFRRNTINQRYQKTNHENYSFRD